MVATKKTQKPKKRKRIWGFTLGKEKDYFVENLSMLLSSGMDILLSLQSLKKDTKNKEMKKVIDRLIEDVESGYSFWKTLERSKFLNVNIIALVRVGEESGKLIENLNSIAREQEKDREFKAKVKSAMMYPVLVLSLTFVVALGISWFILPRFVGVFKFLKTDLPLSTRGLMWLGDLFFNYGYILVPGLITAFFLSFYFLFYFSKTKKVGQWMLFYLPISSRVVKEIQLANFGRALGSLLDAGLPIVGALTSLRDSTDYYNYKKLFTHLLKEIKAGSNFLQAFQSYKNSTRMIPISIQQMIDNGEKTGKLKITLLKIGEIYQTKAELTTKNLSTLLEPVLLILIGIVVLVLAISIITPIYGLLGTIG